MGYIILWQIVSNRGNKQINHKSFFFVPCPLLSGSGAIQLNALADIYLTNFYLPYFAFMLPQHLCHVRNFLAIFLTSRRQNHFSELGLVPVSRRRPAEYADSHFRWDSLILVYLLLYCICLLIESLCNIHIDFVTL